MDDFFRGQGIPTLFGQIGQKYYACRGQDIPPLWHGLFVLYKINIAIATTNKGVKWSVFVKTTANMESYGVSFSSRRKTLWRQLQNYELDHQLVTLL